MYILELFRYQLMQLPYLVLFTLDDKIQKLRLQIQLKYKKVVWWSLKLQNMNPCVDQLCCAFLSVLDICAADEKCFSLIFSYVMVRWNKHDISIILTGYVEDTWIAGTIRITVGFIFLIFFERRYKVFWDTLYMIRSMTPSWPFSCNCLFLPRFPPCGFVCILLSTQWSEDKSWPL